MSAYVRRGFFAVLAAAAVFTLARVRDVDERGLLETLKGAERARFEPGASPAKDAAAPGGDPLSSPPRPAELSRDEAPAQDVAGPQVSPAAGVDDATLRRRYGGARLDRAHPDVARAIAIQERHAELLEHPAVAGTAVGLTSEGEIALVVYTKAAAEGIPASLEDLPVVVRRGGPFASRDGGRIAAPREAGLQTSQRFDRDVPIGVSTGHPDITAGTIGCRVKRGGLVYALSNNHVYANENKAEAGDVLLQPGRHDGGAASADEIGSLAEFKSLIFGGKPSKPQNVMDAALAFTTEAKLGTGTPAGIGYGTPSSTTVLPALNAKVAKVGRTTGYTKGTITGVNAMSSVGYDAGTAYFKNQIIIEPGAFSDGGDSGSLIVSDDAAKNPVGLLFAGSASVTIANEIDRVLAHFGVSVDDTPTPTAPAVTISSPAHDATFLSGAVVEFLGAAIDAVDGDLSPLLAWTSNIDGPLNVAQPVVLSDGKHLIKAAATNAAGKTGSFEIRVTVGKSTSVSVTEILYRLDGGRSGDRNLLITVGLRDNFGDPAAAALVSIQLSAPNGTLSGQGTTGADGRVTFQVRNAVSGAYSTRVTSVSATGLTWDESSPPNSFLKP